jgi:hypothetical protein
MSHPRNNRRSCQRRRQRDECRLALPSFPAGTLLCLRPARRGQVVEYRFLYDPLGWNLVASVARPSLN